MRNCDVEVNGKTAYGTEIPLPKAPLVLVRGSKGFVMCGYLNVSAAEKLGEAAAVVRGVATVDDLLKGKVSAVTRAAAKKGVRVGMSGRDALARLL